MEAFTPIPIAVGFGIATHALYFNRYECHLHGLRYLLGLCLAHFTSVLVLTKIGRYDIGAAIFLTSLEALGFLAGLYSSLIIYRICLNPLNDFPGPWYFRLGNLMFTTHLSKSDAYSKLQSLHQRYGNIVRIGSNDLSIIDPTGIEISYGPQSEVTKSHWYDADIPMISMHNARDRSVHARRRKYWAPAFSDKALGVYEEIVDGYNETLAKRIRDFNGEPVNVTKWFSLYSFDVMGSLAFGKDYGMLVSGEKQYAMALLSEALKLMAYHFPVWLVRILICIPGAGAGYAKFSQFCKHELMLRVRREIKTTDGNSVQRKSDIASWLLEAYHGFDHPEFDPMLQGDCRLLIVAGSDTTSATLTFLFYHLAKNPPEVQKIKDELRSIPKGLLSDKELKKANHLNGAINEALRLHPPVPSGTSRLTPENGLRIGETIIPGKCNFIIPQYVLGRGMHFIRWNSQIDPIVG